MKIELDLIDTKELKGADKYKKFMQVALIEKQIKEYKDALGKDIKPSIKKRRNQKYEDENGTISYYDAYTREQINKDNIIDKFGYDAIKDCLSIINVSDRLAFKEK